MNINISDETPKIHFMSIGFPGSGKSTLFKCLEILLLNSKRINQDECEGSAKMFNDYTNKYSKNQNYNIILLDKCYHNEKIRNNTLQSIDSYNVIYIIFYHPADKYPTKIIEDDTQFPIGCDHYIKLCKERINLRGFGHLNLFPYHDLNKILQKFVESSNYLTNNEISKALECIYIDMTLDKKSIIEYVLNCLKKLENFNFNLSLISENDIEKAIDTVQNQENQLSQQNIYRMKKLNIKKIKYWAIKILDPNLITDNFIVQKLSKENSELILKNEYYIDISNINKCYLKILKKEKIQITITHIIYDDKTMILKFYSNLDYISFDSNQYLIVASAKEIMPFHSNMMLMLNRYQEILLEKKILLSGKIVKITNY